MPILRLFIIDWFFKLGLTAIYIFFSNTTVFFSLGRDGKLAVLVGTHRVEIAITGQENSMVFSEGYLWNRLRDVKLAWDAKLTVVYVLDFVSKIFAKCETDPIYSFCNRHPVIRYNLRSLGIQHGEHNGRSIVLINAAIVLLLPHNLSY